MALDVYVMPLWRFKVGDFSSPIETGLGVRPKIVTAEGIEDRPAKVGWFGRRRARREVNQIRTAVKAANGVPVDWLDEGDVVYSQQSWGFEPVRAFARWLDCRGQFPVFESPPDRDYYKHPVMATQVDRWTCSHLIEHSCYSGYYFPCEFERIVEVEPYLIFGEWPASRQVGSSPRLIQDLAIVQSELQVPDEYDYPVGDPLMDVKRAYLQLREVAELSCRHGLPIIFSG